MRSGIIVECEGEPIMDEVVVIEDNCVDGRTDVVGEGSVVKPVGASTVVKSVRVTMMTEPVMMVASLGVAWYGSLWFSSLRREKVVKS